MHIFDPPIRQLNTVIDAVRLSGSNGLGVGLVHKFPISRVDHIEEFFKGGTDLVFRDFKYVVDLI